jgi:2-dehydropantoate 2-reductase
LVKLELICRYEVVRSQAEALEGDVFYDYCMITTKCLPDIVTTPELVKEVIASKKVGAWSLLQVGPA